MQYKSTQSAESSARPEQDSDGVHWGCKIETLLEWKLREGGINIM